MNIKHTVVGISAVAGILAAAPRPAQAQEAAVEGNANRLTVDLRDASLDDALTMIFKAVGDPTHSIDPAAKTFNIGTYHNQDPKPWNDIVRTLATMANFKFSRDPADGSWRVEPRVVATTTGGIDPLAGATGTPSDIATFGNRSMSSVRVSPQIAPRNRGGVTGAGGGTGSGNNLPFVAIPATHVYLGGIALLFEGADVLGTRLFVQPLSATTVGSTNNNNQNSSGGSGGIFGGSGGSGGSGGIFGNTGGTGGTGNTGGTGGITGFGINDFMSGGGR